MRVEPRLELEDSLEVILEVAYDLNDAVDVVEAVPVPEQGCHTVSDKIDTRKWVEKVQHSRQQNIGTPGAVNVCNFGNMATL